MKGNKWLFIAAAISCMLFCSVLLHLHGGFFGGQASVVEETIDATSATNETQTGPEPVENSSSNQAFGKIVVYVSGAVKKPGVYSVTEGARLYELLSLAGGFTEEADRGAVNLAERVKDGQQRNFPSCIETAQKGYKATSAKSSKKSSSSYQNSSKSYSSRKSQGGKSTAIVNINSATAEELQKVSGIGPKTAQLIIDYRTQNGDFTRREDLLQIKGIGPKKYEKMKGSLTLGE